MKYRCIADIRAVTFEAAVQQALDDGYEFYGDLIFVETSDGKRYYIREMVKDVERKKTKRAIF